jgi:hypothetical protein
MGNIHSLWDTILTTHTSTMKQRLKVCLAFLKTIYTVFGDRVFQQYVSIPMGTNCAPLLADLFLYSYEAEFVKKLLQDQKQKQKIAMFFKYTYRYIDDIQSINNHSFHNYVHLIYPNELEIKNTRESDISASCLDILLNIDSSGRVTTTLYDKVMILTFQSSIFLFYVGIYHFHLLMMCISPSWFDMHEHVLSIRTSQSEADCWQKCWCCRVIMNLV